MKGHKRVIPYVMALGLVVAGSMLITPAARAEATFASSQEINQLLVQVKTEANALENDTDLLAKWAGSKQLSWHSHVTKLDEIKRHINEAGQLLAKLNDARATASPWQQQAIARIHPLLRQLADNTETTINHVNDNQAHIQFSAYQDYAQAGSDLAEELAALINNYVDFSEHEAELLRLEQQLSTAS